MKLSIIVPIYNAEKTLKRLMDSILTSGHDFEVLCINDGSIDNSLEVLESMGDTRIKVFTKENEGTFKTWQYGLKKACGEYVTIMDQDDYIDSDYIAAVFEFIENTGADVFVTPYYIEQENGTKKVCKLPISDGLYSGENINKIRKKLIGGSFPYAKFTKVIKRIVLLEQVEHTYQGNVRDFEDWLTMI